MQRTWYYILPCMCNVISFLIIYALSDVRLHVAGSIMARASSPCPFQIWPHWTAEVGAQVHTSLTVLFNHYLCLIILRKLWFCGLHEELKASLYWLQNFARYENPAFPTPIDLPASPLRPGTVPEISLFLILLGHFSRHPRDKPSRMNSHHSLCDHRKDSFSRACHPHSSL